MKLYWLVELDPADTALRTLAVVGEDGARRSHRFLSTDPALTDTTGDPTAAMGVDVDVVMSWAGHRLGLLPVASPPLTRDLDEAVTHLAARVASTMREAS